MQKANTADNLLSKVAADFIGLDTVYKTADGRKSRRIYLDSTASTLMMCAAHDAVEAFYNHYANTHSILHFSARISSEQYQWAHERILSFIKADPETYTCFFTGSGTTSGINRLARVFRDYRPDRHIALISLMEHHSNDLPHRKHAKEVIHIPLDSHEGRPGCINMEALEYELKKNKGRVNYVAVTGVSNVTGIINPIYDIAELAHEYDALILVDGAQLVAHLPVQMSGHKNPNRNIDALVFSGHKTYVPGSPGAVICRKKILENIEPEEVGGGMVENVYVESYEVKTKFPDREEAGTPNIPGAIGLATAIDVLDRIGMQKIFEDEEKLVLAAMDKLQKISGVIIYGEIDSHICPRAASISFNVKGMDHGLVAAILNDYHNIAVRNECFCAHPYVKEMILDDLLEATETIAEEDFEEVFKLKSGMVRVSFGLYNTMADVDILDKALIDITGNAESYIAQYHVDGEGNYRHNHFKLENENHFSISEFIDKYING
ncbi:MAG: aminotransferase class V-fold PLP-dependent enzyme [Candidatus Marinimicrobia bacterium]|nr:aminotransferase class V-fold PLP-dependent enzyme [Candidatus Neomarinimicrobiota bacterium]